METTSLPTTCGEESVIPGTPSVGCVSVLQCHTHTAAGFSCCVVGSHEAVYLLGPNLHTRDRSMLSVRLWRAPPASACRVTSVVSFLCAARGAEAESDDAWAVVAWDAGGGQEVGALRFSPSRLLAAPDGGAVRLHETSFAALRGARRVWRLFHDPLFASGAEAVVLCGGGDDTRRAVDGGGGEGRLLAPVGPRAGRLSFVTCGASARWGETPPPSAARWLRAVPPEAAVCAVAVQGGGRVAAALGTACGRVLLLSPSAAHTAHRVGGPVADLAFVDTRGAAGDGRFRNAAVTARVEADWRRRASSSVSLGATPEGGAHTDGGGDRHVCLVVLDSAGRIVVLRAVNGGAPIFQRVADIQQCITLARHRGPGAAQANPAEEALGARPVSVSSKHFVELSSLLLFFHPRRQRGAARQAAREVAHSHSAAALSETESPASRRRPARDDAPVAGNILSRGLLSLAWTIGPRGGAELVVSTMGQCIVSIPFDRNDGTFSIAGFVVAPEPMFYVGFVDFFNTGVPELVMAGAHHVLLARRPRRRQKERAALLLRLLAQKLPNTTESIGT